MTLKKTLVLTICFLTVSTVIQAQTDHSLKLLFHGAKSIGDSTNFGVAGWLVAPNVVSVPDKWLMVLGPRYNGSDWWIETMGGFLIQGKEATSLIDIRAKFPNLGPITPWTNVEWIGLTKNEARSYYVYFHFEYFLPWNIGNVGIETENVFKEVGDDIISAGPHLAIPFSTATFVVAYQFHKKADNQVYFRMVVNF